MKTKSFAEKSAPTMILRDNAARERFDEAVRLLQSIDIDGETCEHLLKLLGMHDQMGRQLGPQYEDKY